MYLFALYLMILTDPGLQSSGTRLHWFVVVALLILEDFFDIFYHLWPIFFKCDPLFHLWPILFSVTQFSTFDPVFQVRHNLPRVTHFSKCYPFYHILSHIFLSVTRFSKYDQFFQMWLIFFKCDHYCPFITKCKLFFKCDVLTKCETF